MILFVFFHKEANYHGSCSNLLWIIYRSWCDSNGEAVVKKELKDHVEERESTRGTRDRERRNSKRWTTFEDEENSHPNLFAPQDEPYSMKQVRLSSSRSNRSSFNNSSIDKGFRYNPFFDV